MDDKVLLNIALIVGIIGITALLLLSYYDEIPEKSFNEITSKDVASYVKVKGTIQQIYVHNNSISIKLSQECLMNVNVFDNKQDLNVNDTVSVQGTVQEYNGKMQILADKITK